MIDPNLSAEMARKGITQAELADKVGRTRATMSLKLNGNSPINLDEARAIKDALQTNLALETLFDQTAI